MNDSVYVRPPPTEQSKTGIPREKLLWRLVKALYGLRKAPRYFQRFLAQELEKLGWIRLKSEPQVWRHPQHKALLLAHVDDILLATPRHVTKQVQAELEGTF